MHTSTIIASDSEERPFPIERTCCRVSILQAVLNNLQDKKMKFYAYEWELPQECLEFGDLYDQTG
jgi:hypothetical protein